MYPTESKGVKSLEKGVVESRSIMGWSNSTHTFLFTMVISLRSNNMAKQDISAKAPKVQDPATGEAAEGKVEFDFGDNLDGARKLWGDDVIFNKFKAACVIDIQGAIRRILESGVSPADVPSKLAEYKPGVSLRVGGDPVAAIEANWGSYTKERKAEILQRLADA